MSKPDKLELPWRQLCWDLSTNTWFEPTELLHMTCNHGRILPESQAQALYQGAKQLLHFYDKIGFCFMDQEVRSFQETSSFVDSIELLRKEIGNDKA